MLWQLFTLSSLAFNFIIYVTPLRNIDYSCSRSKQHFNALVRFQTGSQDNTRILQNLGEAYAGAMAVLKMTLPGTSLIYYGEEIGMVDGTLGGGSTDPAPVRVTF